MWYAIQTKTGREQELQDLLKKYRDETGYRNCFQLKRETVRRYQGDCIIYTETLFPGYLFVDTDWSLMSGDFVRVRVTGANEYDLIGEIIEE